MSPGYAAGRSLISTSVLEIAAAVTQYPRHGLRMRVMPRGD